MTEDEIERSVERKMDILDRRLLKGELTQEEYNIQVKNLAQVAKYLLRKRR